MCQLGKASDSGRFTLLSSDVQLGLQWLHCWAPVISHAPSVLCFLYTDIVQLRHWYMTNWVLLLYHWYML